MLSSKEPSGHSRPRLSSGPVGGAVEHDNGGALHGCGKTSVVAGATGGASDNADLPDEGGQVVSEVQAVLVSNVDIGSRNGDALSLHFVGV